MIHRLHRHSEYRTRHGGQILHCRRWLGQDLAWYSHPDLPSGVQVYIPGPDALTAVVLADSFDQAHRILHAAGQLVMDGVIPVPRAVRKMTDGEA